MPQSTTNALALSRGILRVLIGSVIVVGALILALLVASLVSESAVMSALGARPGAGSPLLYLGMRAIAVLALLSVPVWCFVLTRLLAMVETVRAGDPFIAANAVRLRQIAWAMAFLELMHFGVSAIAVGVSTPAVPLHIGWDFFPTRWLAVLLLFVLARVFEQGTSMREDLAGTI